MTYRSEGPNVQWEYFKKLHPAIRIIRELGKHMEKEFNTLTRGKKHGVPKKEMDIKLLEATYQEVKLHDYIAGRQLQGSKRDRVPDLVTKGAVKLHSGHSVERWRKGCTFAQSHKEDYEIFSDTEENSTADTHVQPESMA